MTIRAMLAPFGIAGEAVREEYSSMGLTDRGYHWEKE
jgi:hypothetical protein